ncbi:hypothetical protein ODW05_23390, partial [Escherichia coli]|nr:hypothetical protein [Escherichia coli]
FRAHLQATSLRALSPLAVCGLVRALLQEPHQQEAHQHTALQSTNVTVSQRMLENFHDYPCRSQPPCLTHLR